MSLLEELKEFCNNKAWYTPCDCNETNLDQKEHITMLGTRKIYKECPTCKKQWLEEVLE